MKKRTDVMQNQGVWEVLSSGKRERTYFLAQHTLLQVCHLVGAVLDEGTSIIAWLGAWDCSGEERMDLRPRYRGMGGVK